jgi:hypothetical protein
MAISLSTASEGDYPITRKVKLRARGYAAVTVMVEIAQRGGKTPVSLAVVGGNNRHFSALCGTTDCGSAPQWPDQDFQGKPRRL